jgi:uncharacterized protein (TIGR03083 family)
MPAPTAEEYVATIGTEADALVEAATRAGLDATVPSCPDWDVAALLAHIGRVHRWAAACVERGEPVSPDELPASPPAGARPAWVRDGAAALVAALRRPATDSTWTWYPDGTVGFWQRRQAHETGMHRVDAELASGPPAPIPAGLAADGIDELLMLLPARPNAPSLTGDGETLHLHCTDVDGEWLLRIGAAGPEVERIHAKGDVAARGRASDLLCVLSRRLDPDRVEILGDRAVFDGFLDRARF